MFVLNSEVAFLLVLILANAVFALAEIAIVSARTTRLISMAEDGNRGAAVALALKSTPDQFLATVQVGITLIGILTGAFGGATLAKHLADWLARFPQAAPYREALSLILVVSVITYLSLVIGELVPKRLALSNPEQFATQLAPPMQWLARVASPAVRLLSGSTTLVTRLLGMRPGSEPDVTEEELRVMLAQSTREGVIQAAEHEMVDAVFRLGDRRVGSLGTPRPELVWLDATSTEGAIRDCLTTHQFSRILLCDGSPDRILGVVNTRRLLLQMLEARPLDLHAAMEPALFIPATAKAVDLLETFRSTGNKLAVAIDEHGGTQGIVTVTDLFESIVGDMPDASDVRVPDIQVREDGSWLVEGSMPLDELRDRIQFRPPAQMSFVTLGGLVTAQLGRIPTAGEFFHLDGYRFEVMDMDGHRVDKVLINQDKSRCEKSW